MVHELKYLQDMLLTEHTVLNKGIYILVLNYELDLLLNILASEVFASNLIFAILMYVSSSRSPRI